MGLLKFKADEHSQNGEDGIIERIFGLIGAETRLACEFGAWDGIHLSNIRKLILEGWSGLFIEADPKRFEKLRDNYSTNPKVGCVCKMVNDAGDVEQSLTERGFTSTVDLLSIDIDGLDYDIFQGLRIRPRVICIEVTSGHSPEATVVLPRDLAAKAIGQPLAAFCRVGADLGYRLIAYNGNAFFLRNDITHPLLGELEPVAAYTEYLEALDMSERRWMYLVNKGLVFPFYRFGNDRLTAKNLRLGSIDVSAALARCAVQRSRGLARRVLTHFAIGTN
jgi:hypothetical protein